MQKSRSQKAYEFYEKRKQKIRERFLSNRLMKQFVEHIKERWN